ncbi:MAG: PQQ-binding-like beta-propeller repeat protein, partial [Ktedonobacteraceae bacterium]
MMPILPRKIAKIPQGKLSRMRLLALLLMAITLIGTTAVVMYRSTVTRAAGGDWSTYLHDPQRSNAGSDTTLSPANAGQVTLNWAFKTGGPIAATPAIVGGTAYVGSWDGYEYALDAATGAQKWKTFLGQTTAPCYPQLA